VTKHQSFGARHTPSGCQDTAAMVDVAQAELALGGAAAVPSVRELLDTRNHVQWHGMERAMSATERTLERLEAEKAWAQRERRAAANSLYAMTTPRRVNKPPLRVSSARRPGTASGISSSATSAGTFQEKMRAREEERRKQIAEISIHDGVVFTSEVEAALTKRLCPNLGPPPKEERQHSVFAWEPARDCRATASRPWPEWHGKPDSGRVAGRKLLDPKGSGKLRHGTEEHEDRPSTAAPGPIAPSGATGGAALKPKPPAQTIQSLVRKRKGTPTDRRWHNFGTPTRALERRMVPEEEKKAQAERTQALRDEPKQRAGYHKGVWYGEPTAAWGGGHAGHNNSTGGGQQAPDRSRVHGQYTLRKEQATLGGGVVRGYVPAVTATAEDPAKYAEMKAWIRSMAIPDEE
jgi:hypothetical protein